MSSRLFVHPPLHTYSSHKDQHGQQSPAYTYDTYVKPGIIQTLRRRRLELTLRLAQPWFGETNAIDFGCADGIMLPSLSRYFRSVAGIDASPEQIAVSNRLIERLTLHNCTVVCNDGATPHKTKRLLSGEPFSVMFFLGVAEHIGEWPNVYESKMDFIDELFSLLTSDGVIIISVPKMVGLSFFLKVAFKTILRMSRDGYTVSEWLKASFRLRLQDIESQWKGHHKGFNDLKFGDFLRRRFTVLSERSTIETRLYVVRRQSSQPNA